MLPKPYRLTKKKDFDQVYKMGKFYAYQFLMCKILKTNLKFSRFGVVVGVKVSKKATKRNKAKRRLREVIRLNLKKIEKGFDVIVMAKPEIVDKEYDEINKTLTNLFNKAGLLK